ncbi:MAG TPA: phosphomannomutase/phosphoglucomutase [Acidimicrobiia bacterium]|jgi:phosphomannomutase
MEQLDTVFKAYDIRGRTDLGELTPELAKQVGGAFAILMGAATIGVGRDCRLSSPGIATALMEGMTEQGVDVLDLGTVATDTVYYFSGSRSIPGAVVTASHNPPEYNGIKFCRAGAAPVGADTGLQTMKEMVAEGIEAGPGGGTVSTVDATAGYVDHLLSIIEPAKLAALRVAVDGGNGMAGVVCERVFDLIPPSVIGLYLEPDGTFPNHPADPLQPENLVDLIALVQREKTDLGVAFDGDADRAFFIDDQGAPLSGSTTTALIARWFLARRPGSSIVHNLITSRAVAETIRANGGVPVRTRVGHSYIKQVMAETGAVFGGEHSGHYYFADNYRADSGMLAMLVLLQVISEAGVPLSKLRTEVEPYVASGEINLHVSDQAGAMDKVEANYPDAEVDHLDGLTISWPDAWFNLRPSNTEPVLRLNVEAGDQARVNQIVSEVEALVGAPA